MASIKITIETDGAAFHEERLLLPGFTAMGCEVARILRQAAKDFEYGKQHVPLPALRDNRGNVCGKVEIID